MPPRRFRMTTPAERARLVAVYLETGKVSTVKTVYKQEFHRRPVSASTILKWVKRFGEYGCLQTKKRARRVGRVTPKDEFAYSVAGAFEANPSLSLNEAGKLFGVDRYVIRRALLRIGVYPCEGVVGNGKCKAKKAALLASVGTLKAPKKKKNAANEVAIQRKNNSDEKDLSPCTCVMCYDKKDDQQPVAVTTSEGATGQA